MTRRILRLAFAPIALALCVVGRAGASEMDDHVFTHFLAERLEYRLSDGSDSLHWDAQAWAGEDYNKLWLKTEGKKLFGGAFEEAEVQLLYSRLIAPFWDIQAGGRFDVRPQPERGYGVLGVHGLAPYFFEVDAASFVSNKGDLSARLKGEYELLLSQKLVLQPSAELNLAVQEVKELGIGSGLTDVELGLRFRYEVIREFAPYVGVSWTRKVGRTADFAREDGEDIDTLSFVTGIRFWF
jgi:copper resistance protein B